MACRGVRADGGRPHARASRRRGGVGGGPSAAGHTRHERFVPQRDRGAPRARGDVLGVLVERPVQRPRGLGVRAVPEGCAGEHVLDHQQVGPPRA